MKTLIRGVYNIQWVGGGFLLVSLVVRFVSRQQFVVFLARGMLLGGSLTLTLLLVMGVCLALAFPLFFNLFHELSFANDFWKLNPQRDNLIIMFPEGFWFAATMFVVLGTVLEALVLTSLGWLGLQLLQRNNRATTQGLRGKTQV